MRGLFVTGTGTAVGKTVVAAALARSVRAQGREVAVFKPAVSGLDDYPPRPEDWRSAPDLPDHALLRLAGGTRQADDEIAPYRFGPAVSPHLAAAMSDESIDPVRLRGAARLAAEGSDLFVCEGVGGFLVPLSPRYLVRDFARDLGFPVVIVAPPGLGTINHSLLTIEAVRDMGLAVCAVVLTPWPANPTPMERSNLETIAGLGSVRVETLPRLQLDWPESWPTLELPEPDRRLEAA